MKVLLDIKSKKLVEDFLNDDISANLSQIYLRGLKAKSDTDNNYFWYEGSTDSEINCYYIKDYSEESIWKIDELLNPIYFEKKLLVQLNEYESIISQYAMYKDLLLNQNRIEVVDKNGNIYCVVGCGDEDSIEKEFIKRQQVYNLLMEQCDCIVIYCSRERKILKSNIDAIRENINKNLQLNTSDIYLMIPGKIRKGCNVWDSLVDQKSSYFRCFHSNINYRIHEEYASDFSEKIQRKCIHKIQIKINDFTDGKEYIQDAIVGIVLHDTGFCIIEIMVPNCNIGGNKLLNYYCGNNITIIGVDGEMSLDNYIEHLQVRQYGKKRSMSFIYSDIDEQELINALANEEYPMGKIGGAFSDIIKNGNIAQYDTAEVYVSNQTMIENCNSKNEEQKRYNNIVENRLMYQAIEIFFVELILFQDAAIDKVYCDLNSEEDNQKSYQDVSKATKRYEQLSFDMALAMRFGNYEQFYFPSTRISAKNVARQFGVDCIFEKYNLNKELLAAMISANGRCLQEKQEKYKNRFLLIISALATIGTLGEIIYNIGNNRIIGFYSYSVAIIIVVLGYYLYTIGSTIIDILYKRKNGKKENNDREKK